MADFEKGLTESLAPVDVSANVVTAARFGALPRRPLDAESNAQGGQDSRRQGVTGHAGERRREGRRRRMIGLARGESPGGGPKIWGSGPAHFGLESFALWAPAPVVQVFRRARFLKRFS